MQRIMIIDGSKDLRNELRIYTAFVTDVLVVGDVGTAAEGMVLIQTLMPSLVVMAIELPDVSGLATCRQLRGLVPSMLILMLTNQYGPQPVVDAMKWGAHGCVMRDSMWGILRAIRVLLAKQRGDEDKLRSSGHSLRGTVRCNPPSVL